MLATIRHQQKSILIVITAIIIVSFAWLYNRMDYDQPGLLVAFTVGGREYRVSEAQKLMRSFDICRHLGAFDFLMTLSGRQSQDRTSYAVNLLVLREHLGKLGIRPSDDQIQNYIREAPSFQSEKGYDPASFNSFTTDVLVPNGFSPADLYELIGDVVAFSRLQELLGANLPPPPAVVDEGFRQRFTEITAARVDFPKEAHASAAGIPDEAVKSHYEANKSSFMSEPKRRIEYVLFEKPEAAEGEIEEVTRTKLKVYGETVAEFAREVLADGADFAAIAAKHGATVVRTEPFAYDSPPEALKDSPEVLSEIFSASLEIPVSDPINTAKGYVLFNLLAFVEPQALSLEEAAPLVRERLKEDADAQALRAAAEAARAKIAAELAAGRPFAEAAAAAGLAASDIPPFSRESPPADNPDSSLLLSLASRLDKGELSEVIGTSAGVSLIYIKDKKAPAGDTVALKRTEIVENLSRLDSMLLFEAWFRSAREGSGVSFPAEMAAE